MQGSAAPQIPGASPEAALGQILEAQRRSFLAEMPVPANSREDRLDRAAAMLLAHRKRLHQAAMQDFPVRGRDFTYLVEIAASLQVLMDARKSVRRWMRPQRRNAPVPFNLFGARAQIQYQPLGVVGIMGAWNAPINLVLVPLATALAAGNRAMLCPSDLMTHCAQALDEAVREYFDSSELAVAHGGLEISRAFSRLQFDHLLFTGSPPVGAMVMQQAAPNLVPVTLELGGKCPVLIGPDADLADTARTLVATKTMNGGQACLAPDLVFVPRGKLEGLLGELDRAAAQLYPGAAAHPDYCGIVNQRHFSRVESLLEQARQAGAEVRPLGVGSGCVVDQGKRRMALHAVIDPAQGSRAMNEEIFGPVFTVIGYDDLGKACESLRAMPKPLGLYVFSRNGALTQSILDRTFSGGVTVNDALFHYSVPELPFGGVGRSGMGSYSFGIEGFRRFSHARSVYYQAGPRALLRVMQPPYGGLFDLMIRKRLEKLAERYARRVRPPNRA